MNFTDFLYVLQWWTMLFSIGVIFFPLTQIIFPKFSDQGYAFSKILGTILCTYTIFVLGTLHIVPFTYISTILILVGWGIINYVLLPYLIHGNIKAKYFTSSITSHFVVFFALEELLFFTGLVGWSYIRSFFPEINGLEKFMDFGFINSILRSSYFPPKDMWFTPYHINYYYFGHLITAVLTQISQISSFISYNLMVATIFACTLTGGFSIVLNLLRRLPLFKAVIGALLGGLLVSLSGNLHALYSFFTPYPNENPVPLWTLSFSPETFPNAYWYPNATRYIYHTIHEFPLYSFVVSDLHGHVLSIPIVLTIIALLLHEWLYATYSSLTKKLIVLGVLIATAYMTNAWDGIIYMLFTVLIIILLHIIHPAASLKEYLHILLSSRALKQYGKHIGIIFAGFLIFSLPFSLYFKPFVSGIGVLCAPEFLTSIGHIGSILFEPNHCQRSPWWQLLTLYGFFGIWTILFLGYIIREKKFFREDLFVIILIALSVFLIIVPEFIYAKDIYPDHYRANTMFKLVYQSFIMLSFVSVYSTIRLITAAMIKKSYLFLTGICITAIVSYSLVFLYPFFAINSFYGNLLNYQQLDGLEYFKIRYPTDYEAIRWIQKNIKDQPVIAEAQGDSYTDYARISANTGLPTILGWTVHEWLWRGSYDIPAPRIQEVQTLYETNNQQVAEQIIKKYNVSLIFIGYLERQKYPLLQEEKFRQLGSLIYQNGNTRIYQVTK